MSSSSTDRNRLLAIADTAGWPVLAAAALGGLAFRMYLAFDSVELAPAYGTAWMPYSDALGPWLLGGLSILFDLPPPEFLYRPTIALFWGSLLAATGRTQAIPVFFCACLLAFLATMTTMGRDSRARQALVVCIGICVIGFTGLW